MTPRFEERRDGSEAEGVFRDWAAKYGVQYVDYGFRRPPIDQWWKISKFISHTPDFVIFWQGRHYLLETKGMGKDGVLKIKTADMESFFDWSRLQPFWFFIWNSYLKQIAIVTFDQMDALCKEAQIGQFEEGNKYYAITSDNFEWRNT